MSVPSAKELRQTRQPIRSEQLLRWAEEGGFILRHPGSGGSHVSCRHDEFPDVGFNIILNQKSYASQKALACALMEIEQRRASIAQDFKEAVEKPVVEKYAHLPDHITVEHDFEKSYSVLRSKHFPQIGATIRHGDERLMENIVRHAIETPARDVYLQLCAYRKTHAIKIGNIKSGVFEGIDHTRADFSLVGDVFEGLSHSLYNIPPIRFEPFQPDGKSCDLSGAIADYVREVETHDWMNKEVLKCTFDDVAVRDVRICFESHRLRGERLATVIYDTPKGDTLSVSFASMASRWENEDRFDLFAGRVSDEELEHVVSTVSAGLSKSAPRAPKASLCA